MAKQSWTLVENPAWWNNNLPGKLTASACHDRSHFLTIACQCSTQMHVHETQITGHETTMIASTCHGCGQLLAFEPGALHGAFAEMRQQGWIV